MSRLKEIRAAVDRGWQSAVAGNAVDKWYQLNMNMRWMITKIDVLRVLRKKNRQLRRENRMLRAVVEALENQRRLQDLER